MPDSFKSEIFEYPASKFDFDVEYTDWDGQFSGFAETTDGKFGDSGSLCHGSNPCEAANSVSTTYVE